MKNFDKNRTISADKIRFKQIIHNLLSNAYKYTKKGEIVFELKDEINNWKFNLADTGIGIKKKDYQRIFEDFERGNNNISNKTEGFGLGLSITKRIVELYGGFITIKSKVGKGSTFSFILPKKIDKLE